LEESEGTWLAHDAQMQALPRRLSGTRASVAALIFALVHQHSISSVPAIARAHSFGFLHKGQV